MVDQIMISTAKVEGLKIGRGRANSEVARATDWKHSSLENLLIRSADCRRLVYVIIVLFWAHATGLGRIYSGIGSSVNGFPHFLLGFAEYHYLDEIDQILTVEIRMNSCVPPGFRFHPTDEELLYYYLKKKVSYEKIDLDVIRDVDLNKLEPWDLHVQNLSIRAAAAAAAERCKIGSTPQNEWYFFSHKDKKYPTGSRTNRATAAGFWKATGRDKAIRNSFKRIGMRKTLVFYRGRAPHGQKTEWIMHEYRLEDNENSQEDGWVVCRVFKKRNHLRGHDDSDPGSNLEENSTLLSEPKDCPGEVQHEYNHLQQHEQQSNMCKQELGMHYSLNAPHHDHQFMQMTQLAETHKFMNTCTNTNPSSSSSGIKRLFPERVIENVAKRINYHLPSNMNNNNIMSHINNNNISLDIMGSSTSHAAQLNEIREEQLNDWTALDRLVASHLNPEDSSKEIRYVEAAPSGSDQLATLPLRSEIDLWNFGK
eukprot:Gb_24286 [translate_table: standard]